MSLLKIQQQMRFVAGKEEWSHIDMPGFPGEIGSAPTVPAHGWENGIGFWQAEKAHRLLSVLLDMGVGARIMQSTHLKTIYSTCSREWQELCVLQDLSTLVGNAVQTKCKRLKGDFYEALECWQGIPDYRPRPPHFNLLYQLWEQAGKPSWWERWQKGKG